jgi:hypothetical protein
VKGMLIADVISAPLVVREARVPLPATSTQLYVAVSYV